MTEWAWDRTIVCHPEDESALRPLLERLPLSRKYRLLTRSVCNQGRFIVIDDEKVDAVITKTALTMEPFVTAQTPSFFDSKVWALEARSYFRPYQFVQITGC